MAMNYRVSVPRAMPPYVRNFVVNSKALSPDMQPLVNLQTGTYWFVDNTDGDNTNDGRSWQFAKATIQAAVNAAVAEDTILIKPGTNYAENVTVTAKHGLTLMAAGVPGNSKRVAIAPTTGIALTLAQNKRVSVIGIRCVGVADVGCLSDSEGSYFENCDFTSDTVHGFKFFANTDNDYTGSGSVFEYCLFRDCGGAGLRLFKGGPTAASPGYGLQATNVNLYHCQFYRNTGDDIDDDAGTESPTYWYQWHIDMCYFMNRGKSEYLDMNGGDAGQDLLISNCYFNHANVTATEIQLPTNGQIIGCFDLAGIAVL